MAAKRRVTPNLEALGGLARIDTSAAPSFPLVPSSSQPVTAPPNWAASLTRFNKGLSGFFSGQAEAASEEHKDLLIEAMKSDAVTDEEIQIEDWLQKNKKPNIFHPAVPVKVVQYTGAHQADTDVRSIVNSKEFLQYAWTQLNNDSGLDEDGKEDPRDYLTKLKDEIYGNLPNRKYVGKTAGPHWRRGYDPAVELLASEDKLLAPFMGKFKQKLESDAVDANVNEATRFLQQAISSTDDYTLSDWGKKLSAMKVGWPSTIGRPMRDDIFNKSLQTTFQAAATEVDVDVDDLARKFNSILNLRFTDPRTNKRGGYIFDDLQRQEGKIFLTKLFDAESNLRTRRKSRDDADQKELAGIMSNIFRSFPQMAKEHESLSAKGIKKWSDLTPDNFMEVVGIVSATGWLEIDQDLLSRVSQGARVSLFNQTKDAIEAARSTDISNEASLAEAEAQTVRNILETSPQYKAVFNDKDFSIREYLTGAKTLDNLVEDMAAKVDAAMIKTEGLKDFGVTEEGIAALAAQMIEMSITGRGVKGADDSPAAIEARQYLQDVQNQLDNNHQFTNDDLQQIINVAQESFVGDEQIDADIERVITRVKSQMDNVTYYKHFNEESDELILRTLTDSPDLWGNVSVYRHATRDKAASNLRPDQQNLEQYMADAFNEELQRKVEAAGGVYDLILKDYGNLFRTEVQKWKDTAINRGVAPEQLDDEFEGAKTDLQQKIIDKLKHNVPAYEKQFKETTDALNREANPELPTTTPALSSDSAAAESAAGSRQMTDLRNVALNLRADTEMANNQFQQLAQELHGGDGASFDSFTPASGNRATAAVQFYENADDRYDRLKRISAKKDSVKSRITASLVTQINELNTYTDAANQGEQIASAEANIANLKSQLVAHTAMYDGIPWEDLNEGKAEISLPPETGVSLTIPVSYNDKELSLRDTLVFKQFDETITFMEDFNFYEEVADGVINSEVAADFKEHQKVKLLRGAAIANFAKNHLKLDIMHPDKKHRTELIQKNFDKWLLNQQSRMISSDPDKLPEDINIAIKRRGIQNFIDSGDRLKEREKSGGITQGQRVEVGGYNINPINAIKEDSYVYRGKRYNRDIWEKVKAISNYNDFLLQKENEGVNPLSAAEGITPTEFLTLAAGLNGGRIAANRYDFSRPNLVKGLLKGKLDLRMDSGSWYKTVRSKKTLDVENVTPEDWYVMAEELALAEQGLRNPTNLNITYQDLEILEAGGLGSGSELLPKDFIGPDPMLVQKYLDLFVYDAKSPELGQAYRRLYDATDIERSYITDNVFFGDSNELLDFEIWPMPLPARLTN